MISVLYVDDDSALLDIGKIFLEKMGNFSVETCTSAPEALKRLEQTAYHAVLSDYDIPGMNGIEFLKAVRVQSPALPFIIFTGRGREDVVVEAINNGVDFYLQKGGELKSQFAELSHKLRIAVKRRAVGRADPAPGTAVCRALQNERSRRQPPQHERTAHGSLPDRGHGRRIFNGMVRDVPAEPNYF